MKTETIYLNSEKIVLRYCKYLNEKSFLEDLQSFELSQNSDCPNQNCNYLTCCFISSVKKDAPLKTKVI